MMGFELAGHYVWDFWFACDTDLYHLFCLTAPRTKDHPDLRHPHARICHATSTDLVEWNYEGVVIAPSARPAWDDGVTWTGSVVRRPDGLWIMFYTGARQSENLKKQRIGAATSVDLYKWEKLDCNPLLEIDNGLYETYSPARWHDEAFRDPWVYEDPEGAGWRMLFTARHPHRPAARAGVIGQAKSVDLLNWTLEEPISYYGYYGEMEVPQLFELGGWWYCLFSNSVRHREPAYIASGRCGRATGTHYLRSRHPSGPFELVEEEFFAGDIAGHLYGGKTVMNRLGELRYVAFLNHTSDGTFVGSITNPMRIWATPEGHLRVDASAYGIPLRGDGVPVGAAGN